MNFHLPFGTFFKKHFPTFPRIFRTFLALIVFSAIIVAAAAVGFNIAGSAGLRDARNNASQAMLPTTPAAFSSKYPYVDDRQNAANFYLAAGLIMRARGLEKLTELVKSEELPKDAALPLPQGYHDAVRALLEENRDILEILHEGASREKADYQIDLSRINALMPHLSWNRSCGRLLSLAAVSAAEEGRASECIGYVRDCMAISVSYTHLTLPTKRIV